MYVEVSGESFSDDLLVDKEEERELLNVSLKTKELIENERPSDMSLDSFLQDLVEWSS